MKKFVLVALLVYYFFPSFAQNKVLDAKACYDWPTINEVQVSSTGQYVCYNIFKRSARDSILIKALDHSFERGIAGASDAQFTPDSRYFIYMQDGDKLHVWDLGARGEKVISDVLSYQIPSRGEGRWLGYTSSKDVFTLLDLKMDTAEVFQNVPGFQFSESGKVLLLRGSSGLFWVDLQLGARKEIWSGRGADGFVFDREEDKVAFLTDVPERSIWISSGESAKRLVAGEIREGDNRFELDNRTLEFSADGQKVFFSVTKREDSSVSRDGRALVHIWRYNDPFLKELQGYKDNFGKTPLRAVAFCQDQKVIVLSKESSPFWRFEQLNEGADDEYLLVNRRLNLGERDLHEEQLTDLYLCNTDNGDVDRLATRVYSDGVARFSPAGKYVFWYDFKLRQYVVYNIREKSKRVIGKGISGPIYWEVWDQKAPPIAYGVGGWSPADAYMWIYDRYDIWRVDPEGREAPVNMTSGYGRKHRLVLRLVHEAGDQGIGTVMMDSSLLLCAFDERTKANGFFKLGRGALREPVCLRMMDSLLYFQIPGHQATDLLKAGQHGVYLLKLQKAEKYPNWVSTTDFIHFDPVSDLAPQTKYNWLRSELLHYKTMAGHEGEGILYKPTDFNPRNKYPLILFFYERMSDMLNVFMPPELTYSGINIPWFVSRGYLVFCPDLHFKIGAPGKGIYDYVVSAAKFLGRMPWVDSSCIGIQSHSFGGFEVDYLVTHTNIFAAAEAGAGTSDLVSQYDELSGGAVRQDFMEYNQYRMGGTPWQNMQAYIDNSPIFKADKVNTPLLLMNNKDDPRVPEEQGMEFFLALRRMGKPVWMLQYDGSGHSVIGDANQADYTRRLEDFFDCYLKKKPMPKWMVEAVE